MTIRTVFALHVVAWICFTTDQVNAQSGFDLPKPIYTTAFADQATSESTSESTKADDSASPVDVVAPKSKVDPSRNFGQETAPVLPPITYLRNQAVLLKRGQYSGDIGAVYSSTTFDFPIPLSNGFDVVNGLVTNRALYVPLAFRYGLKDNLTAQVFLPVGITTERLDVLGTSNGTSITSGPIGDTFLALNYSLPRDMTGDYDIILTNFLSVPTGQAHGLFALPDAGFGRGYYEYGSSVLGIRRYDPVLVFGGVGLRYGFPSQISGIDYDKGFGLDYQYGVGFGVNETTSLSCRLFGSFEQELQINHRGALGTERDLIALRFAVTHANEKRVFEPFVTIGSTAGANDIQLGMIWTFTSKP